MECHNQNLGSLAQSQGHSQGSEVPVNHVSKLTEMNVISPHLKVKHDKLVSTFGRFRIPCPSQGHNHRSDSIFLYTKSKTAEAFDQTLQKDKIQ